jgi:hypothetical protein
MSCNFVSHSGFSGAIGSMKYKVKWRAGGEEPLQPSSKRSRSRRRGLATCSQSTASGSRLTYGMKMRLGRSSVPLEFPIGSRASEGASLLLDTVL